MPNHCEGDKVKGDNSGYSFEKLGSEVNWLKWKESSVFSMGNSSTYVYVKDKWSLMIQGGDRASVPQVG